MGTEDGSINREISYSEAMLEAARQNWEAGDLRKAEAGYRLVISENPDNIEACTELCILLLQQRRETDAEKVGKQLLKLKGEKGTTWAQLRSELRSKHIDKKPQKIQSVTKLGSKPKLEEHSQSISKLFVEEESDSREIRTGKSLQPQPKQVTEIRSDEPQERNADNWYEFGKLYLKQEKYPDAIRAFRKAVELEPRHLEALIFLGQTLFNQEAYNEAISPLNRALTQDTDNTQAWYLLGLSYLRLGKYWDASQALYECVKIDEHHIDAWAQLGIALTRQGRHVQAQKALLRALKVRRKDPDLLFEYARSLKEEGKLERAENVLRMTVGVDPKSIKAWSLLGDVLMMLGKIDEGRRAKDHARHLRSKSR